MNKNKKRYDKYKKFDVVYADFGRNHMEYRAESDLELWYRVMQVIMVVHLRFQLFHYHQN